MTEIQNGRQHKFDLESRTTEFAKRVVRLCRELPRNEINRPIIPQIVRSAGSVGANYREANDALGKKDFIHRMKISRKETKETIHWSEILMEVNSDFKNQIEQLIREAQELKSIFSSIISKSQ